MSEMSSSSDKVQAGEDPTLDAIRKMVGGVQTAPVAPAPEPADDVVASDKDVVANPAANPAQDFDFAAMVALSEAFPEPEPEPETPDPAPAPMAGRRAVAAQTPAPDRARRRRFLPDTTGITKRFAAATRGQLGLMGALVRAQVLLFLRRPDAPRLIAIAVLAIFVLAWPGFVIGMFVTAALIALIIYLSLGPDRVAVFVYERYVKLKARDPNRAEALRARAAATSATLTAWLERLPDSWTAGLYLPDFEEEAAVSEKLKDDPFVRLASQAEINQEA